MERNLCHAMCVGGWWEAITDMLPHGIGLLLQCILQKVSYTPLFQNISQVGWAYWTRIHYPIFQVWKAWGKAVFNFRCRLCCIPFSIQQGTRNTHTLWFKISVAKCTWQDGISVMLLQRQLNICCSLQSTFIICFPNYNFFLCSACTEKLRSFVLQWFLEKLQVRHLLH